LLNTKVESETVPQADEEVSIKKEKKQNYNEPASATITIVPDDGPVWPKHVVLE
jgi:hypothetical protein